MSTADEPATPHRGGGLVRVRLDIAYDGTEFSGWARQPGRRTVQGTLQDALVQVLRLPEVELTVAGRTDAGVHATGQVAHLDLPPATWHDAHPRLIRRLGGVLPGDLRVRAAEPAPEGFDARFSARWRRYGYRVSDAQGGVDPLRRRDTLWWRRSLDAAAMDAAAQLLLGEHDFAAYCRYREGATTVRGLLALDVRRAEDTVTITAQADAFCHSMVRSLVGALLAVGEGQRPVDWPASLLSLRERANGVAVAPPHGLTLQAVGYPVDGELAARTLITRNRREPVAEG